MMGHSNFYKFNEDENANDIPLTLQTALSPQRRSKSSGAAVLARYRTGPETKGRKKEIAFVQRLPSELRYSTRESTVRPQSASRAVLGVLADRTQSCPVTPRITATSNSEATGNTPRKPQVQHLSFSALRALNERHIRSEHSPQDKYRQPLVTSQEVGWNHKNYVRYSHSPRVSSEMTKYAHVMIRNNHNY